MRDPLALGYLERHPRHAARSLARLAEEELAEVLAALGPRLAAGVLLHAEPATATRTLRRLPPAVAAPMVAELPSENAAERLRGPDKTRQREILALLPRTAAARLRILLRYAEGTIGSVVDTDVLTLSHELRVGEAVRRIRGTRDHLSRGIYVLDERYRLKGMVDLCRLLGERDRASLARVLEPAPVVLNARASIHTVDDHPAWVAHESLPVVNRSEVFQGVLPRAAVHREDASLLSDVAERQEIAATQWALADVFWLALSGLFAGSQRTPPPNRD